MRTVNGVVGGLVGVGIGVALLGHGLESTRRAMMMMRLEDLPVGALTVLLGGAVLGVLAGAAHRLPAAPVTAGAALLALGALSMLDPSTAYGLLGSGGIADLVLMQVGTAIGAVLLVAALVARPGAAAARPAPRSGAGGPGPAPGSGPIVH
ncbi:hypothetical protein GCM10009613_19030 [Pseudonocardia kongjuensis]|uniref:Uncharacterized protein n=1 Tax=Pseudonocardia kongjuensis TaxID=102227 RepID=A0ABP4IEY5_9PSEU